MAPLHDYRVGEGTERAGKRVLVFFHGYGSSGREMADYLGPRLASLLPGTVTRFPDGPLAAPWGERSWFAVEDMLEGNADGNIAAPRALAAMPEIHSYIDRVLTEENIDADRLILAGFSQGATMAFFAGLQREGQIAGLFSISGGALDQVQGIRSSPPVMLLAGADEDSAYSGRQLAVKTHGLLAEHGFEAELYLTPENGHNIDRCSVEKLAEFVDRRLPVAPLLKTGFSTPCP